ncbi:hypothetical protein DY000_02015802 [Brassica cretica]|uniref:Uncharacterized protein n=1 Tax=Brassica cretica TaxID=69181 RepID=A0ABQ7D3E0_BRACR|nr:hypothetical protein DY000_02015802 [Brassica cretica]
MLSQSFHVRPVFQDGTWDVSRVAHWFDHSTYIEWFDGLTTRRTSSGSLVRSLDVRRVARWFDHPMYVSSHSTYVGWFYGLITRCEKKDSDVEMSDANPLIAMLDPLPSDGTPACVAGFLSFRDKAARRNAEKRSDTEITLLSAPIVVPTHEPDV